VIVRGGKVVLQASSYDELTAALKHGRHKDGDRILRLPPMASNSGDAKRAAQATANQLGVGQPPDLARW
jgi:hypothetical protein